MGKKAGLLTLLAAFTAMAFLSAGALAEEEDFPPRVNPGRLASVRQIKNPVIPDSGSIAAGKEVYFGKGLCVNCHGETGQGNGPGAASFSPLPRDFTNAKWQKVRSDGEIFIAITEGTQFGMIPFGDDLTERERWDLVNYLRTFGKPEKK